MKEKHTYYPLFCIVGVLMIQLMILGSRSDTMAKETITDRRLYVIATAHLDTQWRWTIQTTITDYIPITLHRNFELFEKYPDYVFSFEGAFRYMLMKEYYPEDYNKLKEYIAQERWAVCGSWVDAVDVNVPSPESLIRHVLYGNGYFMKEFGKRSADIFLPDCFGFGYALPSIAAHCAINGFSTQKLTWGSAVGIPYSIGTWEGVDGSRIIATIDPGGYNSRIETDLSTDNKILERIDKIGSKTGVYIDYKYFGVGDVGGAPDPNSVAMLQKAIDNDQGKIRIISAPADRIFYDLKPEDMDNLPAYKGELLMTTHATGCYTSQAAMKRWNRKNEMLANAAEAASVIADRLGTASYPRNLLKEAWIRFLWHQFHDDLTGTSIPEAYVFSWNDEIISLNQFADVLEHAAGGIALEMDTRVQGRPLVLFNPLAFEREEVISAHVQFPGEIPQYVRIFDDEGNETLSQIVQRNNTDIEVVFLARVPSLGSRVYDVRPSYTPCAMKSLLVISQNSMENSRYRLKIDKNGDVSSIYDKKEQREILAGPIQLQLLDNPSPTWPAWEILYDTVSQQPRKSVAAPVQLRIREQGPVRSVLEIQRHADDSTFIQRIALYASDTGDRIDFENEIDWQSKGTLLKAAFPLMVENPRATYDLGLGTIERGNNTPSLYEVPAQQWADITSTDNSYGVAILNDCKYGWDKPTTNTLRLTLIHTPKPQSYPDQATMDIGHHVMKFAVCSHRGDWREGEVSRRAARLNQPVAAFQATPHPGKLGKKFSFMQVDSPQVDVKTIKKAENSDNIIIRLQELYGKPVKNIHIRFMNPITEAHEVNGLEEILGKATIQDGALVTEMEPYRPRAFSIRLEDAKSVKNLPVCRPLPLPYNQKTTSLHETSCDYDFDGKGYTLPAELFHESITIGDIVFKTAASKADSENALSCTGQVIELPSGDFNRLYFLANAVDGDTTGTFLLDGKTVRITIHDYHENIGQWNNRIVGGTFTDEISMIEPAYIKKVSIAWVGTHRHFHDATFEPYAFCYLFKYSIPLTPGAGILTLPNDETIKIFAMTVANDKSCDIQPAQAFFDDVHDLSVLLKTRTRAFIHEKEVPLICTNPDAEIRYTLDGSIPMITSQRYTKPLHITKTTNLKARAFLKTGKEGPVMSALLSKLKPRDAVSPDNPTSGLAYRYYEGQWRNLPDFSCLKPVATGTVETFSISPSRRNLNYGIVFDGYIKVPSEDIYEFYTNSDDGSKLYIGDQEVVDNDGLHGAEMRYGTIALKPGYHPIIVAFFQRGGDHFLEVGFRTAEKSPVLVDSRTLFHTE